MSRSDRIQRLSNAVADDIYNMLFRLGSHSADPQVKDPREEIRFRVEGAMITAACFEDDTQDKET